MRRLRSPSRPLAGWGAFFLLRASESPPTRLATLATLPANGREGRSFIAPPFAMVRIRAHEHPAAFVVGDDLIEIGVGGAAQRAGLLGAARLERMILEIERHHASMGRDRVDTLLAAGAEQLQRR